MIPSLSQRVGWADVLARAKSDAPDIDAEDWDTLALAWPVLRFRRGLPSLEVPLWASELRALIVAESRLIPAA